MLRDAKYAIECGDTAFSAPFRWLLLRAIAIGRRRETLKDTTLKQYRKRYGDDRAGCELTIGADVDPAAKRRGW
jgi:hypothetical protein